MISDQGPREPTRHDMPAGPAVDKSYKAKPNRGAGISRDEETVSNVTNEHTNLLDFGLQGPGGAIEIKLVAASLARRVSVWEGRVGRADGGGEVGMHFRGAKGNFVRCAHDRASELDGDGGWTLEMTATRTATRRRADGSLGNGSGITSSNFRDQVREGRRPSVAREGGVGDPRPTCARLGDLQSRLRHSLVGQGLLNRVRTRRFVSLEASESGDGRRVECERCWSEQANWMRESRGRFCRLLPASVSIYGSRSR